MYAATEENLEHESNRGISLRRVLFLTCAAIAHCAVIQILSPTLASAVVAGIVAVSFLLVDAVLIVRPRTVMFYSSFAATSFAFATAAGFIAFVAAPGESSNDPGSFGAALVHLVIHALYFGIFALSTITGIIAGIIGSRRDVGARWMVGMNSPGAILIVYAFCAR